LKKGFTLIELLIVIVIIAILAAVVFVALDPVTRFAQARNSRRWNDVNSILTAIHEYIVDNNGSLPTGLSAGMADSQLGTAATGCEDCGCGVAEDCGACVNLSTPLARYLASIPEDPSTGTAAETRYSVTVDANNIVTVKACGAELEDVVIQVSR
jgi:prepilin-type N-terminal cleavage/methylation domain-containing protein